MFQRSLPRSLPTSFLRKKPKPDIRRTLISEKERTTSQLSRQNLQSSLLDFHRNGVIIIENAVSQTSATHVHQRMLEDFHKHRNSPNIHFNQGRCSGNISQTPPLLPQYLHEEIWANRFAVDVMSHILGPRPQLSFATSNIVLPGTKGRQAVHSDYYCPHFDFPVFLEMCVYLHDVDSSNGSTEFWLGTHNGYNKKDHSSETTGWIRKEVFAKRGKICEPTQPEIKKGSICIRDLRCWHAGRENLTDEPRIIPGFMYSPRWFGSHMRMRFPMEARSILESWEHIDCLETSEFIEGDFDYLDFNQNINLSQTPADPDEPWIPRHGSTVVTPDDYWEPGGDGGVVG